MLKDLKKSDLRTGWRVKLKNGEYGMVCMNSNSELDSDIAGVIFTKKAIYSLQKYDNNLQNGDVTIMEVYQPDLIYIIFNPHMTNFKRIWKRESHLPDINPLEAQVLNELRSKCNGIGRDQKGKLYIQLECGHIEYIQPFTDVFLHIPTDSYIDIDELLNYYKTTTIIKK